MKTVAKALKGYLSMFLTLCLITSLVSSVGYGAEDAGARAKAIADAAKASADAERTRILTPAEKEKLEAETVKLIAEAEKALSEANLNAARTQQIYQEIEALKQRMRIADYEFQRIASADFVLQQETSELERNANLVRPLVLGRASWKTWVGLEYLIMKSGDPEIIGQVMFDVPVPLLSGAQFISAYQLPVSDFTGGNLGELYQFARNNDLSFRPFGEAHKMIMKIVVMINKAVELKEAELRDINQSIRLTIAKITNT